VKELVRVVNLLSVTLLYCFAASTFTFGDGSNFSAEYNQSGFEKGSVFSAQSSNLLQHTTQVERTTNVYSAVETSSFKTSFSRLPVNSDWDEQILINDFITYLFRVKSFVFKCSISNIIFPFHYFW
jgi:hypothetical protein